MSSKEVKSKILNIIDKHLKPVSEYQVLLFGLCDGTDSTFDIGIDSGRGIPYKKLHEIEEELRLIPSSQKIYLFDLARVSHNMKNIAVRAGEVLR